MAIFKSNKQEKLNISSQTIPTINVHNEEDFEYVKFNKEEYIAVLEEGKKQGYNEGLILGQKEGYEKGITLLNEETAEIKRALEDDISNMKSFMDTESIKYIDRFREDIYSLVNKTINKIFFNAIQDKDVMTTYLENLTKHLGEKYKNITIIGNENTIELLNSYSYNNEVKFITDNTLFEFDVKVISESETIEFYLKDEFERIKDLFS